MAEIASSTALALFLRHEVGEIIAAPIACLALKVYFNVLNKSLIKSYSTLTLTKSSKLALWSNQRI